MSEWEDNTDKCIEACIGRRIVSIALVNDVLTLDFECGSSLVLEDKGQSCCEHRHMSTDDDINYYSGSTLLAIRLEDGPEAVDDGYIEVHEQQFLHVQTSKGFITVVNHNEHNGYYGGFCIRASVAGKPVL